MLIKLVRFYQKKGGGRVLLAVDCNFTPSCSDYFCTTLQTHGFFKGFWLGLRRIARCSDRNAVQTVHDPVNCG